MGEFGQDAGVTPLLFFEGHPGIFNDHRESGVLQMDAEEVLHDIIYIDEAGFNLTTVRRRGINIIGHRTIDLSMYQDNVGETLPFVLPLHRMGSSTAMPTWVLTTLISFLHF